MKEKAMFGKKLSKSLSKLSPSRSALFEKGSMSDKSNVFKYMMIGALVLLLFFSAAYIYNIQSAITSKELFSNSDPQYTVVYIYSTSCGYCTKFAPVFQAYTKSISGTNISTVSYEKSVPEAASYMPYVTAFPTILIFDANNKMIGSNTGSLTIDALTTFVTSKTT